VTLRVLVIEDRPADAELAIESLRRAGLTVLDRRVDAMATLEAALVEFEPDVVLCDNGVPGLRPLGVLARIKQLRPQAAFILVSGALEVSDAVACMKAGADDAVDKADLGLLAGAVRDAIEVRERLGALTARQIEVLRLVVEGKTTREIAATLGVSEKTVETHRSDVMRRLDLHEVAALVRFAVRVRMIDSGA